MIESADELAKRTCAFEEWRDNVRDPANRLSEGKRWIRSGVCKATICYEIAPLSESQYAVQFSISYGSGTMYGQASPWTVFATRKECIDRMLETARNHFGPELVDSSCSSSQQESRTQILKLLQGDLFGFIEPDIESDCSDSKTRKSTTIQNPKLADTTVFYVRV
jgi:hypothetical protein